MSDDIEHKRRSDHEDGMDGEGRYVYGIRDEHERRELHHIEARHGEEELVQREPKPGGKHVRQSGGHGQFGDVHIKMS